MLAPLLAPALAAGQPAPVVADYERAAQANLPELMELLAIPNVADEPADIHRNAVFPEAAFKRRGFAVRQLNNPAGWPLVFAEFRSERSGAKTVLLYMHFDGQPVVPADWAQADPFQPAVKQRVGDAWVEVPRERLQASPLDPELRVFARAASDDKAPIIMLLSAIDLFGAQEVSPALHVKVLLDSEEEIGLPSLAGATKRHHELHDPLITFVQLSDKPLDSC